MRFMLQLMIFTAIGSFLLAVTLWFFLTVASVFQFSNELFIRPFRMVSPDSSQSKDGEALAQFVTARLAALVSLLASKRPETLIEPYRSVEPVAFIPTIHIDFPAPFMEVRESWRWTGKIPTIKFKAGPLEVQGLEGFLE